MRCLGTQRRYSLKVAIILEKSKQMLPESLSVMRLVWLDGLYEIQVKAVLLV